MPALSTFFSDCFDRFLMQNACRCILTLQQRWLRSRAVYGLPEKPKKPLNAWMLFFVERRKELLEQAEYRDLPSKEFSKKISQEWRNFDELDKIPYREKYEESLVEYREKLKTYESTLTPEDKRRLRSAKLDERPAMRKFEKEFPRPKYPGHAYSLFVKSTLEKQPPGAKDWMKDCALRWHDLTDHDKEKFYEEALLLGKKYREEVKEWKEKYQEWKKTGGARR